MIDEITMKIRADELIRSALAEDVTNEDVSTACILRERTEGEAELLCKQDGVIAGLPVFARVFAILDEKTEVTFLQRTEIRSKRGRSWRRCGVICARF